MFHVSLSSSLERMERKVKMVVLKILSLWIFALFVVGQSSSEDENVINLVAALKTSHRINGLTRLQSSNSIIYKIRTRSPQLTLPSEYSHLLYSNFHGSMGIHLVARQSSGSTGTVFSLSNASSPILQIVSSVPNNTLHLDYQAKKNGHSLASFAFPGRNPFSSETWVQLAVSLEPDRLTFFVDCQEAAILPIKSENRINLELPQDVAITLGSTSGKRGSKFSGYFKKAEISLKAYQRRPWICDSVTDDLPPPDAHNPDSRTDSSHRLSSLLSKLLTNNSSQDQTSHHRQDSQSDQMQRRVVLGPPRSPRGEKSVSEVQRDDRLKKLERRMGELAHMLNTVRTQNEDLQARVTYLERRECVRQQCVWEGRKVEDGYRWQIDANTVCSCTSGKVTCQTNTEYEGFQQDGTIPKVSRSCVDGCQTQTCDGGNRECFPQPCSPQPCQPSQPCSSNPCPSTDCTVTDCGPADCGQEPRRCQPDCTVHNVSHSHEDGCQMCTCDGGNRECSPQLCSPQPCQPCQASQPSQPCSSNPCPSNPCPANPCLSNPCPSDPCPANPCPSNPCPSDPCPSDPCLSNPCPSNPCPSDPCPSNPCPSDPCPSDACPSNPCPSTDCTVTDCGPADCGQEPRRCQPDCTVHNVSHSHVDGCQTHACDNDNRECSPQPCPSTDCTVTESTSVDSGQQLRGCSVNGNDFPDGAKIPIGEPCQECTCVNGNVACSPIPCPAVSCHNPVYPAGECCPRCEQCEYESEVYVNGQKFTSRRDPCLQCSCSAGQVLCERMDASCPTQHCSHPVKHRGECCATCNDCEYEQRVYADGTVFTPPGSGPCLQCICKAGNVICHEERCPPVQCANPVRDPHLCCPVCRACVSEGVEYEDGSNWQPEGPCSSCTCVSGETICTRTRCPPTDCQHPTKITGSCCAVCDSCTYGDRIYSNGQRFLTHDQPCHICTCLYGTVHCEKQHCPPLNCSNSYTPPGECCPKCPDCIYGNHVFLNGETFTNPSSACEECACVSGQIDCHQTQCPAPRCNAPLRGTCCQNNCNGCSYAGKEYPDGEEFSHPTDLCRTCHCTDGNVQCLKKRCPPLSCSNPIVLKGECCPQCPAPQSDCVYKQQSYRHAERFYHPTDNCRSCACNNGTVRCQRNRCPYTPCSHPISQECCQTCEGCLYEGQERVNGETWNDRSDPCIECVCREGSVECERKRCPPSNCNYPVQRQCCMSCDGCTFQGREYLDGTEFGDDRDPCIICHCSRGDVTCTRIACNGDCSHPYIQPRQCCGECERCSYNGVVLLNGQSIPDPGNPCSECICQSGSVRCTRKQCPQPLCAHPVTNPCGCPVCDGCQFQGVTYADGQIVPGGTQGCQDCTCSRGEMVCEQKGCPPAPCPHPVLNTCACEVCDGCNFAGRDCSNGEQFLDPTDHCQHCSCLNGQVVCARPSCPSVACRNPVTPPGECCPVCTGICLHENREYQSGSTFTSPSDPCSSCTCLNEVVDCRRRPCNVQCSHPVPSHTCCPVCDSCLYEGEEYSHMESFRSASDPCQFCTCDRGTVTCVPSDCPQAPCGQPVPGQCSVCMLNGREFSDGETWTLSSNHCSTCTCKRGEVHCAPPECPKLPCTHQVTDPGACCPRCRGCVYGGKEHTEGSSWFADSTPCMRCMCVDGVTTCSEVHCLSPCVNFISVPGECCPVCADCIFEGRVYGPGDSFHPANDPCQICTCEVMPDGEQHLKCYRKQCPSLVDCPKSNILFSGPDTCCPACAQPLSNCTAALIGNEVLATDDPCFTCHCKDLTWTCLHQVCPPLTCPLNEQFTPPDSCCPVCKDCVIEDQNRRVLNGTSWKDSDDNCVTCTCNLGYIECSIEECLPVICLDGQYQVKTPGKCCYECQDSGVSCLYQGTVYNSNEHWEVDQCTSCTCVSGDVHCHSERCPLLSCAADEMPAVVPGLCCPHCLPRPATCIAFGDPHYRTFDGHMFHFQGTCTYVLAQDCRSGDFSIQATNDDRGRKGVSWTKEVTVFLGDVAVQLLQDWVVKVNDEIVTLPFLREPYIYIERQTNTVLLNTNIGLKVLWSPRSHVEVSVPGSYKGHTCGLCGNFNSYYQDDLRMPNGQLSLSESDFANSWRVTNGSHFLSICHPGKNVDPCKDAGYQAKKGANARCKILKSAVFKPCHHVVPPEQWYGACVYDLCACGTNTDDCLCDALEAYASQCRAAGVILQWRSTSLCAVGCPVERGFVFDECGPPCPVTCFNVDVPLGVIESHCFKPCVPGCQCPAGLVLHNNYCIPPEKCPKIIHGNTSNGSLTEQVDSHL